MIRFRAPAIRRAAATVAAGLVLAGLIGPTATADTQQQLDAARAKLKAIENRVLAGQRQLAGLRARADAIVAQMNQVESAIAVIQAESNTVEREIRAAAKRLVATQAQLDERARITFQTGGGIDMEFILGSTSLSDFSTRLEVVDRATQADRALIVKIQDLKMRLHHREVRLERLQKRQLRQRNALKVQQGALQEQLAAEQSVVSQMNQDRQDAQAIVSQLVVKRKKEIARARRLAALARQASAGSASGPAITGVLLVCPVDQPHSYTDDFGAPRYAGGFHLHQGNDIFAPTGTPIRAPFPGTASVASNGLGGLAVKVFGSQGYVYNAHLSRLGSLGSVSTGTIIGYVGNSGDARNTAPHDHFEWHPGGGSAVSPFPYLNAVC